MIIYLVGFMGAGKSTVGHKLGKILNYKSIDLDKKIEEGEGMTVEEIFDKNGEAEFRQLESRYLKSLDGNQNLVVSTGGGTPCFNNNMELMQQTGLCIYIKMNPKSLLSRLESSKRVRPLVRQKSGDELLKYIEATLEKREIHYSKANIVVDGMRINYQNLVQIIDLQLNNSSN